MGSPVKSDQLRPGVVPSIFVNEQNASEAPKADLSQRPKNEDDFTAEPVHGAAPGVVRNLGQAVQTSPEPACETNNGTEKSVQVQLLMCHEGSQMDEKKILSSTAMQTEPYAFSSGGAPCNPRWLQRDDRPLNSRRKR
ncbi:uncharacterized protein LOC119167541 isoform X2 [Rhipicephalus microplus]|uniref:uncharacterized protein LOC119167541 isoform X2 n=1 Tax=Rhipicephalus microplus TaxID=6941 RepID=UPI003F6B9C82